MSKEPWPKDGLYINELIDALVDYYEKPDSSLKFSGEWKVNMRNKLFTLKQASANANILTVDELIDYLHDR